MKSTAESHGTCRWLGGADWDDLLEGTALLEINKHLAGGKRLTTRYWCQALESEGEIVGVRLTKQNDHEVYHVDLLAESCDCPDATYRPGKACKHKKSLLAALPKLRQGH